MGSVAHSTTQHPAAPTKLAPLHLPESFVLCNPIRLEPVL